MDEKDPKKVAAGQARAASMTPERRSEIARMAAAKKWGTLREVVSREGVISVGGAELQCYVLDNQMIGYRAELLPDVCDIFADAERAGKLRKNQLHIAAACRILSRGLTRLGIIGLVDEATGYQHMRAANALAKILETYIAKELQPWVYTFGNEFYQQLFRLRGLDYQKDSVKRPQYFGHLTNDIIYRRLAPGVLDEIKRTEPKLPSGRRKGAIHQRLDPNSGHPKLREHIASVTTIMVLSDDYPDFVKKLNRRHPSYSENMSFDFMNDTGKGF